MRARRSALTAVLHTWTRELVFHPHVHCIVTGGGLAVDGNRWVAAASKVLFPVHVRRPDCDGSALGRRSGAWKYWPAVLVLALDLALAPSTLAALTAVLGDLPFTAVAALAPYL